MEYHLIYFTQRHQFQPKTRYYGKQVGFVLLLVDHGAGWGGGAVLVEGAGLGGKCCLGGGRYCLGGGRCCLGEAGAVLWDGGAVGGRCL